MSVALALIATKTLHCKVGSRSLLIMNKKSVKAASRRRPALTQQHIIETALVLIENDGLLAFSMRKLAQALSCEAMSLYHHFPSKAHLMDGLLDWVLAKSMTLDSEGEPFQCLRDIALQFRAMGLKYPHFYQHLALHRWNTPDSVKLLASMVDLFFEAGFDNEHSARLSRAFCYYVIGAVLDETSGYAKGPSAVQPVSDDFIACEYPQLAAVSVYFKPEHYQSTYETGVDIFIEHFRALLKKQKKSASEAKRSRNNQ